MAAVRDCHACSMQTEVVFTLSLCASRQIVCGTSVKICQCDQDSLISIPNILYLHKHERLRGMGRKSYRNPGCGKQYVQ